MEPFETHPASPGLLRGRALAMRSLAEEAFDLDELSRRTFNPAVAAWDGVAAEELRKSPEPVRERALEVSSELAWAGVPLDYWADRVAAFNRTVRPLQGRFDAVPGEVDTYLRSVYGDHPEALGLSELDLAQIRSREIGDRRAALRREWHEAYEQEIDEGSRQAATLFRDGPTWQNLAFAHRVGAIPATGMFTFLTTQWERNEAPAEALWLANRINDPNYRPTDEEVARLAHLLEHYAGEEEFAYHFLSALGPEGLVTLYANVALLQPDGNSHYPLDSDLATLQATIQAGLGTALAVATAKRGTAPPYPGARYLPGEYELGSDWVTDLLLAGREKFEISVPLLGPDGRPVPGLGAMTAELYGYQLIGGLLGASDVPFDASFLTLVGGDMIDFERSVGWSTIGGEGVPIWYDTWYGSNGSPGGTPLRLNWVAGADGTANAGFDPMHGLMTALADNPDAARQLLTSQTVFDGTEGGRLPIVDYLVTDRVWMADLAGQYYYEGAEQHLYGPEWGKDWSIDNPGHRLLGDVLEVAVVGNEAFPADDRSARIFESLVFELNQDWPAPGRDDMMPSALRVPVANMFDAYIVDVNRSVGDGEMTLIPGRGVELGEHDAVNVLKDLGRDDQAQQIVRAAQHAYTDQYYRAFLAGDLDPDSSLDDRLSDVGQLSIQNGRVLSALDLGLVENTQRSEEERLAELLRRQEQDRSWYQVLATGGSNTLLAAAPTPGFVDEAIKTAVASAFNAAPEPSLSADELNQQDRLNEELSRMITANGEDARTRVEYAAYDAGTLPGLPDDLIDPDTGGQVPRDQWTNRHEAAWRAYLDETAEGRQVRDGATTARERYENSYSLQNSLPRSN